MVKRIRFKFTKTGTLKYLSHLDIISIITRALRRAGINMEYSKGFNPKPKIIFGPPIPLGISSLAEYADVNMVDDIDIKEFLLKLNSKLQGKITISDAVELPRSVKNLMSQVDIAEYRIEVGGSSTGFDRIEQYAKQAECSSGLEGSIAGLEISIPKSKGTDTRLLEVYGYTKSSGDQNNKVFKPRDFLENLKKILTAHNIIINSVIKNELYILIEDKKMTPFEVLQSFV